MNPHHIDAHAHLVPEPLLGMVGDGQVPGVSLDGRSLVDGGRRLGPLGTPMVSVPERLRWMDDESIAEQWVSPWLDLFTWRPIPDPIGAEWVCAVNDALVEVTATSAGRLRPVPFVDLSAGAAAALKQMDAVLREVEAPAVMVNSAPHGSPLAGEVLSPFWGGAAERNVTVMLHPPGNGPSCAFTTPVLQNVSGRVIDASAAVVEMMAAGVFERLPELRVIVVHGGGFLPYQAFRLDGLVRASLLGKTAMTRSPSDTLRRLWYDTVALDGASLELLVRRVGGDRVLLGSDAPFPIGDPHPVRTVRASGLAPAVQDAICCGNARALDQQGAASRGRGER